MIKVCSAEIVVVVLVLLQMIGNNDESMCHGDNGSLLAPSRR